MAKIRSLYTLDAESLTTLDAIAEKEGMNKSEVVRNAIKFYNLKDKMNQQQEIPKLRNVRVTN